MVACTFVSAPLMFVSAKMITLTTTDSSEYIKQLNNFTFDLSVIGLIASIWVLLLYILTKRINRVPHKITSCIIVSQVRLKKIKSVLQGVMPLILDSSLYWCYSMEQYRQQRRLGWLYTILCI